MITTLIDLNLFQDDLLTRKMISELRLTSRSLRDCLNRHFWQHTIITNNLQSFSERIISDTSNNIASFIKHLQVSEFIPNDTTVLKFANALPRLVNLEIMDFTNLEIKLTPDLASMIAPGSGPWNLPKRAFEDGAGCLTLESDSFWDILWERHHGWEGPFNLKAMFPKLRHVTVFVSENTLSEKQLSKIPTGVESLKISSDNTTFENILRVLQAAGPSVEKLELLYTFIDEEAEQTVVKHHTFSNITELSLPLDDETNLPAFIRLFPNLKAFYPYGSEVYEAQDLSSKLSKLLHRHCPRMDTLKFSNLGYLYKFKRLCGLRHVVVYESEDYYAPRWPVVTVFKHMPKEWKLTIETVQVYGMPRGMTQKKCKQVHELVFSAKNGYVSLSKLLLRCLGEANAGAILDVKDGVVVRCYEFGCEPEGVEIEDVYPDEFFENDKDVDLVNDVSDNEE